VARYATSRRARPGEPSFPDSARDPLDGQVAEEIDETTAAFLKEPRLHPAGEKTLP